MFPIQRNKAEHMARFDQNYEPLRGLHELVRIQPAGAQVQLRNAPRDGVVDVAPLIRFEHFLCRPRLVGDGLRLPGTMALTWFRHPDALVGVVPSARPVAIGLPDSREIRFPIGSARYSLATRGCVPG